LQAAADSALHIFNKTFSLKNQGHVNEESKLAPNQELNNLKSLKSVLISVTAFTLKGS
jgi:hypothetical protein